MSLPILYFSDQKRELNFCNGYLSLLYFCFLPYNAWSDFSHMVWMESCKWLYFLKQSPQLFICMQLVECRLCLKWRILSRKGKIGNGKNTKYFFFLLGLKDTLRTCFEPKNFLSNSCPELSNQQLSFSACQIYWHFAKTAGDFFWNFWHLVVKFGHNGWF